MFDFGANYKGESLNEQLLQGPDLTSALIRVVTWLRKEPVVIMADIESTVCFIKSGCLQRMSICCDSSGGHKKT